MEDLYLKDKVCRNCNTGIGIQLGDTLEGILQEYSLSRKG